MEDKNILETLIAWEQLLYPILVFLFAWVIWSVRQEMRIGAVEKHIKDAHRLNALEQNFQRLHQSHKDLEGKVDSLDGKMDTGFNRQNGKLNRIIGWLEQPKNHFSHDFNGEE